MEQWEKQENIRLFPGRDELRRAVTPPVAKKGESGPNWLLRTQLVLCCLLFGLLLAGQRLGLPFYESCRRDFRQAMEQGIQLAGQKELLRLTEAAIREAAATLQEQADGTAGLNGAGGENPARWPETPEGYREESYLPKFALQLPVTGFSVTSPYGWRRHPLTGKSDFHTGLDLAAAEGTAVRPVAAGLVQKTARGRSYGNHVTLLHPDGVVTRYCHMQYVFVRPGEIVGRDTLLGTVGQTGVATGPHLHLELLHNDLGYDPAPALGLA